MRPLGLHQMNGLEVSASELVRVADEVGCQFICLFTHVPLPDLPFGPVTRADAAELKGALAATGITVGNVEFFPLTEDVDIESFRPAVELGAELGGRRLVTIIRDRLESRVVEHLACLADLAAEYGMTVGLEFMARGTGPPSLASAARLVRAAERGNLGLAVDCLHLVRSGGTPEDVAAVPTELFGYAQICDGLHLHPRTDYGDEIFERTVPGEGVFPIAAIIDAVPASTPVDVEVPSMIAAANGVAVIDRVRPAVVAARRFLDEARPTR